MKLYSIITIGQADINPQSRLTNLINQTLVRVANLMDKKFETMQKTNEKIEVKNMMLKRLRENQIQSQVME